jgi:hypothetical protein
VLDLELLTTHLLHVLFHGTLLIKLLLLNNYVTKQIIVFSGSANYTMANVPVLGTEMVFS